MFRAGRAVGKRFRLRRGLGEGKRFSAEDAEQDEERSFGAGSKGAGLGMTMLAASSEVREENQGDADGDQQRAQQKNEADAEQKAYRSLVFLGSLLRGEHGRRGFAFMQQGAEKREIREHPKFNLVPRLPQQIQPGADDQQPDDAEKPGHDYPPRRAVRVSSGEDSWTSPGILACSDADAPAGRPEGCGPRREGERCGETGGRLSTFVCCQVRTMR